MRIHRSMLLLAASVAGLAFASGIQAQEKKATCPVAGREFAVTEQTKSVSVNGKQVSFCCANCPKAFAAEPEKFVKEVGNCPINKTGAAKVAKTSRAVLNNDLYYFCCANCTGSFKADPAKTVKELKDPVTGKKFALAGTSPRIEKNGQIYFFASNDTKAEFEKNAEKYVVQYK